MMMKMPLSSAAPTFTGRLCGSRFVVLIATALLFGSTTWSISVVSAATSVLAEGDRSKSTRHAKERNAGKLSMSRTSAKKAIHLMTRRTEEGQAQNGDNGENKVNPTAVDGYIKYLAQQYLARAGSDSTKEAPHPYWAKP
ncbi:unnamed protein product [Amoebophrya sp. A25]|nr:unnamed protein product [Amoebophrya sp. A25]|eukprot:GSA25T00020774001.1